MTILAEELEFVIGVDAHKHSHSAAVLSRTGGVITSADISAKESGYRYLIRLAYAHAVGRRARAIEAPCGGSTTLPKPRPMPRGGACEGKGDRDQ